MQYARMYTGPDGLAYFEDVQLDYTQESWMPLSDSMAATAIRFGRIPQGMVTPWHASNHHRLVIILEGEMEIEASGGEVRRFAPGMGFLQEDMTGKGHVGRGIREGRMVLIDLLE